MAPVMLNWVVMVPSSSPTLEIIAWLVGTPGASQGCLVPGGNGFGDELSQLAFPTGIVSHPDGSIYVTDYGNNRVVAWTPDSNEGRIVASVGANDDDAEGEALQITMDSNGRLFGSSFESASVYQFLPSGVALVVAGGKGRGNISDQLGSPYGMAFDRDGSLLCVAGSMNDRVVSWKMGGSHGVVVAGGNDAGTGTHQLDLAQSGIALDFQRALYISDTGNNRVMKCELGGQDGEVFVGTNGIGYHDPPLTPIKHES